MNVIEWMVVQLEKDSKCCGNPLRCHNEALNGQKAFRSCVAEVDVEID